MSSILIMRKRVRHMIVVAISIIGWTIASQKFISGCDRYFWFLAITNCVLILGRRCLWKVEHYRRWQNCTSGSFVVVVASSSVSAAMRCIRRTEANQSTLREDLQISEEIFFILFRLRHGEATGASRNRTGNLSAPASSGRDRYR